MFLAFKGIDSRKSACQYYRAIGAVKSCDAQGNPGVAISFDDWKRKVRMEPYADVGRKDIVATYVNKIDLNLTRNHHSISYGPNQTAAYVCNHLGPKDSTQAELDKAIDNATRGRNLVACVAMDHGITVGVNGNQPFTRFLIFGPSGQLLLSVNLDGRTEKFVPGVCVACHGGDNYAGRFPENGTGSASVGAHFLPYDTGNFGFSTSVGLREVDQSDAIYELNQNVLNAGPTPAASELIQGWYPITGNHQLDKNYLPQSWRNQSATAINFYHKVYAKSCRTCHVNFTEKYNFDHYQNLLAIDPNNDGRLIDNIGIVSCNVDSRSSSFVRNLSMPNSLTTFNLYWGSQGTGNDQPAAYAAFVDELGGASLGTTQCKPYVTPTP